MFEQVFEHEEVTGRAASLDRPAGGPDETAAAPTTRITALDQARSLLARAREQKAARTATAPVVVAPRTTETLVQQALDTAGTDRALATLPAVADLLPGGALHGGSAYSVRGSMALVMAMMAGPSADGAWCGVVGLPTFGAEAAHELGVDLERLVLVPEPDRDWLSVVAALADALTVVVVRPPGQVTPGEASRLAARLRSRGAVLISVGSWPGSEARLEVQDTSWVGLGTGTGHLVARQATVAVTGRGSAVRPREHRLWLPAVDGRIRSVHPVDPAGTTPAWQQEAVG